MGATLTEKILSLRAGREVRSGELVMLDVDLVLGNDITSPVAIREFEKVAKKVAHADKIAMVMDHFTPNKDINSAIQCKTCRDFCRKHNVEHFFDVGEMGIEHALLPEKGLVKPADIVIGADSHTCTYGALGAFSTGVGSTDMAYAMKTGKAWFKVPEAIRVVLNGSLPPYVSGKDVILHLIGKIGVDGALYRALEFQGKGVAGLTMDDRFTVANMAIECGAKNGIFAVDDKTASYLHGRAKGGYPVVYADPDAKYAEEIVIDFANLKPTVAFPHLPSNTRELPLTKKIPIDQVVIGSCTNGRLSDIAKAAEILKGRKVAQNVRLIVIPATQQIYLEAVRLGYVEAVIEAGGIFSTPTCGPCLGGHTGILAPHERCVSTTNRNFVGRMGDTTSEVYLANPEVAAASAILGYIASPEEV